MFSLFTKKLFLPIIICFISTATLAQTTEYFETLASGDTTFVSNGQSFILTNEFQTTYLPPWGVDANTPASPSGGSNYYVDNINAGVAGQVNSIKTTNGALFTVESLYFYAGNTIDGSTLASTGTIIFRGKVGGTTVFTHTISSPPFVLPNNFSTYKGFSFLDFLNTTPYGTTNIDELEFELPDSSLIYIAIDNFRWKPACVTVNPHPVTTNALVGLSASMIVSAAGATGYQWQENTGGGFINLTNNANYNNVTTNALTITNPQLSMNGYNYRCLVYSPSCTTASNAAQLLVDTQSNFGTDALIWGTSPFQDSAWSFDPNNNYTVVHRIGPSLPGFTITGITGMAVDPCTHKVYAILKVSGVTGRVLATMDLPSGVCTQIGNMGTNFSSLTFHANGQLYAATGNGGTPPESFFTVDKTTGTPTLVFGMGNGADGEIISYNPGDDNIYHWSGNGTVIFEKWPSTNIAYTPTNIPVSGTASGETFGAMCLDTSMFIISNISSQFQPLTTSGFYGSALSNTPDDIRGLVIPPVVKVSSQLLCGLTTPVTVTTSGTKWHTVLYIWGDGNIDTVKGNGFRSHNYSSTGSKIIKIVQQNAFCSDTLLIDTITVGTVPVVTLAGPTILCTGDSIQLTATGGGTSQWYESGLPISGATTNTLVVTTPGSYNLVKTNLSGCSNAALLPKIVTEVPLPNVVASSSSGSICLGDSTVISATGAVSYLWMPGGIVDSGKVSPPVSTTYTVTGTDINGCENSATVLLTVNTYNLLQPELLYYKFDGTGTTVPNQALTPPLGTATATIQGSIAQGGTGQVGGALIGSGISSNTDFLNTGWAPNLGNSPWTIAFWSEGISVNSTLYYIFGDLNTNSFRCFTNGIAGANNWILRGAGLTDITLPGGALTTPTHNAFVYDSVLNQVRAYLNGVLVNTVNQTAPNLTGVGPLKVMGYSANIGAPSGGKLDEFRFYNRTLNATELQQLAAFPFAIVANDTVLCFGDMVTLTANGPYPNLLWNPGNVSANSIVVVPNATTVFSCTTTDANSCKLTVTKNVTVSPAFISVTGSPIAPITGDTVRMIASPNNINYVYNWQGSTPIASTTDSAVLSNVTSANSGIYSVTVTDTSTGCTRSTTYPLLISPRAVVSPKVFLSGPYVTGSGLMLDSLRSKNLIPLTEPYGIAPYNSAFSHVNGGGGETTTSSVLSTTGNNAIVDWVFIELRNPSLASSVMATQAALVQRDGDVVSARDGISPVAFKNATPGNYYIVIRHRNHLGVATKGVISLGEISTTIDFTSLSTPLNRNLTNNNTFAYSPTQDSCTRIFGGTVRALYAGNANLTLSGSAHKNIRYNGLNNDRLSILGISGSVGSIIGYLKEDVNLSGDVKYNGINNDRLNLLQNVGTNPTNTVFEQTQ